MAPTPHRDKSGLALRGAGRLLYSDDTAIQYPTATSGVFEVADQTRALQPTRENLLDVVHTSSPVSHPNDDRLHSFGQAQPASRPAGQPASRRFSLTVARSAE